jgi:hypothetical protein
MLWRPCNGTTIEKSAYRAPSWSWAICDGLIEHNRTTCCVLSWTDRIPHHRDVQFLECFADFPRRKGYDKKREFLYGDFTQGGKKSPGESSAFLQQWLFFGLMSKVWLLSEDLGMPIDPGEFICTKPRSGEISITTSKLPDYIQSISDDWHVRAGDVETGRQRERRIAINNCLAEAQLYISTCLALGSEFRDTCPLSPEVSLCIMCLASSLGFCLWGRYQDFGQSELVSSRLTVLNWCPSDIEFLNETGGRHWG